MMQRDIRGNEYFICVGIRYVEDRILRASVFIFNLNAKIAEETQSTQKKLINFTF